MGNTKQKSILHYVFKYAGTYKVRYFISIAFALMGVCFSMIPFMLMGKLVENLVKGNRDFQYYKSLAIKIVRNADKIFVVDKGKIVQTGTHDQLMQKEGIYKNFISARKQAVSWKLA